MDNASVSDTGRVRLDEVDLRREWVSVADLASDYWRYQRLTGRAKEADDMTAWTYVHDLVGEPAWEGALDVLDALLAVASDDEIGLLAAGPLEESSFVHHARDPSSSRELRSVHVETLVGRRPWPVYGLTATPIQR